MQGGQVFFGVEFVGLLGGVGIKLGIADRFGEAIEACRAASRANGKRSRRIYAENRQGRGVAVVGLAIGGHEALRDGVARMPMRDAAGQVDP